MQTLDTDSISLLVTKHDALIINNVSVPCPIWHEASLLLRKNGVFYFGCTVLFSVWAKVKPTILTSGFTGNRSHGRAGK